MEKCDVVVIGAGQSGLAAAYELRRRGLTPVVLEASDRPAGSWPGYYDSLTLFSPARHSALPGLDFPGDPERYPHRDEVVAYLERYAVGLDADIRTRTRVEAVAADGPGFVVRTGAGAELSAAGLVVAAGSRPALPVLPGADGFGGELLHVADYRNPDPYADKRVVVVGGGNSAVQIGYELTGTAAAVTLATRAPVAFLPRRSRGRDVHHWSVTSGFDLLPPAWLAAVVPGRLVNDAGDYRRALDTGRLVRRPMFTALDGTDVVWPDGGREPVDAVLLATGYLPNVGFLAGLGALDEQGLPLHSGGLSLTHPGLVYLGLEFQRSFASNTLRGVGSDAAHVTGPLAAYAGGAPAAVGLT
ncbi:NAD(P)/FAD-dependent oxidoreductase [Streptomyces sp. WMMC500]|uniref:flavin-containing monooxygenase n=1 Tax=Streptomyces sp. WMMC500 TaxID=3015154 RepID=UPI00248B32C7|nr:NAD(P)/FAD-dependent oxidoreductase [Streptomyces sp. WMMC500]WBB58157.1 NAD(P)/FAD-dependent oxidoreductase [Streptomyces sp. WMMC500]